MPIPLQDLNHRFAYHKPKDDPVSARHDSVRHGCLVAAQGILHDTPPGREQSLAITKLEEAMMWAIAAIAREKPMNLTTAPTDLTVTAKP